MTMSTLTLPELPVYVCRRTARPISVDGILDEPDWGAAEPMRLVRTESGAVPEQPTSVRVLWDDEYLYVAFECVDTDVWATIEERDGALWDEEVVEVFVDDDSDSRTYLEYEINPLNALVDLYVLNRTGRRDAIKFMLDWNSSGIRHAVRVDGDPRRRGSSDRGWTAEWAIPFGDFTTAPNIPPRNGDAWRINFYRIDRGDRDEYSAWSPTGAINFHVPERFGTLVFSTETVTRKDH
ncbi:MAG TPA: carbohydrate-binding family 9-like protein [Candidatus Latescibacteria bacterium]|nr:carbohydrate-binding family 9-like protein [Candidatus Latescibacterota bacterium]